jgi:UDP-N-acetyl-D-galactosamine dehydrogenase
MNKKKLRLAIIGLGYVGLPLSVEFAKKRKVIGYDININRINELSVGFDKTCEVNNGNFKNSKNLTFVKKLEDIKNCNCYIITVPTPINKKNKPDLSFLLKATKEIGKILKLNDIVIYESTVYPGCTEEKCVPILEKESGLKYNKEFFCGYSPERINPGDNKHKLKNIKKIISGSNKKITNIIDNLYSEIIVAGTYKVKSIIVAEAAKVIENTQRDLNIALVNELSIIFNKLNINTSEVISAAKTKWNFMPFFPGLVGGHCIGVDPYYLTHKAELLGYKPKIILAGRNLNNNMSSHVVSKFIKILKTKNIKIKDSKVLILGLTFKENCPDLRNSKIKDIFDNLKNKNCRVDIYDPLADQNEIKNLYGKKQVTKLKLNSYDGIILGVGHKKFKFLGINYIKSLCKTNHVIFDLKSLFEKKYSNFQL